jgi:hypothetical protein
MVTFLVSVDLIKEVKSETANVRGQTENEQYFRPSAESSEDLE